MSFYVNKEVKEVELMANYLTYKYRIKPNKKQRERIDNILKYVNIVRKLCIKELSDENYRFRKCTDMVADYKLMYPELYKCDSSALINEIFRVMDIKKYSKSKQDIQSKCYSYTTTFLNTVNAVKIKNNRYLYLPFVGDVPIVISREIPSDYRKMKCVVHKEKHNIYSASIHVEVRNLDMYYAIDKNKAIGLDYSNKNFIVDSFGNAYGIPHFYRDKEEIIGKLQKASANCLRSSRNYFKIRRKLDAIYLKSKNQRNDYLHKLSSKLVNDYDVICIESLSMQEISKGHNLGKSTYDNAYYKFCEMLDYKCKLKGKMLIRVNKWYPSSKVCSVCGYYNPKLALSTRMWKCPACGNIHDRDVNAAINIKHEGVKILP